MKIRFGLLHEDLADRFSISRTLTGRIYFTGVKATAVVLKPLLFLPKMENIVVSRPKKI